MLQAIVRGKVTIMSTEAVSDTGIAVSGPVYAYKPSLLGAPFEFHLASDALEWSKGARSGRTPYDRIRRIRLSFRPATMQNYRFLAEIWPDNGPKLQIASTSWRSVVEQERLDGPYRTFLSELNRRVGAAGGTPLLQTGSPSFLYWPGLAIFVAVALAVAALIVRALQTQAWSGAAFVAAFLALFLWQAGGFFRRNRPGTYRPDAVPAEVLPRA
jgi:hypothetical protein